MAMSFRFSEATGVVAALEVHDPDESASLERMYRVLLSMRVQLVSAAEVELGGRTMLELAVCELDGAPVKPGRRRAILNELPERIAQASAA